MDFEHTSLDNKNDRPKQKRSKFSYSCLKCREKRTKCDRKSPCTSCKARESDCTYDTQTQNKPRRPNKDSLILRLSKQLEFYKDLACKYTPKHEFSVFSEDIEAIDYALGIRTLKKAQLSSFEDFQGLAMDETASAFNDQLTDHIIPIKRTAATSKVNVFSDFFIFKSDDYVNTLFFNQRNNITDNFNDKNAINSVELKSISQNINSKDQQELKPNSDIFHGLLEFYNFHSDFQRTLVSKFITKMHDNAHIFQKSSQRVQYNNLFSIFEFPGVTDNTVENLLKDTPSLFLVKIIKEIENKLPPYTWLIKSIEFYIKNFYIEFPFFDIGTFDEIMDEILVVNCERVTLNIGDNNIHLKLCQLSLLMLILYCTGIQEKLNLKSNSNDTDYIDFKDYFELATKILTATGLIIYPTEAKISILCQIWMIINITPDSEFSSDDIRELPSEILTSIIKSLSLRIGIRSDMRDESKDFNVKQRNHRLQLSESVKWICLMDSVLKGSVQSVSDINVSDHSHYNKLTDACEFSELIYNLSKKRNTCLKLIYDCMQVFTNSEDSINLRVIDEKVSILKAYMDTNFNINALIELRDESQLIQMTLRKSTIIINATMADNMCILFGNLFFKGCLLKIYHVVLISAEELAFNSFDEKSNKIFMKYITASYEIAFESTLMTSKFMNYQYVNHIGPEKTLFSTFALTFICSKQFFILLQFVCKCYVFRLHLQMMIMNEKNYSPVFQMEMHLIEEMDSKTSKILFKGLKEYSANFRLQSYQSFKLCFFFDFFKKCYEDGTIFNAIFDTDKAHDPYIPLPKEICDHFMMRSYLQYYDYVDDFKYYTKMLNSKEINDYLKTSTSKNENNFNLKDEIYHNKNGSLNSNDFFSLSKDNNKASENNLRLDENFNFEEYIKEVGIQNFEPFGTSFMF
ncbi:hypothetical protein QEN19_003183 [Hanseniaspora menglaensis]